MNVMSSLAVHTLLQPSEDKHFLLQAVVAVIIQISSLAAHHFGLQQGVVAPVLCVSS